MVVWGSRYKKYSRGNYCCDIGKKGENVGNFRLISGLLLLEIGVVRLISNFESGLLNSWVGNLLLLNAGGI